MIHKRKSRLIATILTLITVFLCSCSCSDSKGNVGDNAFKNPSEKVEQSQYEGFSVHYLDVGQGDCIFIKFDDGKIMLIDCGANSKSNEEYIKSYLKTHEITNIDYFILTHPDADHVGNAEVLINDFSIGKVYLPDIRGLERFPDYEPVKKLIDEKQIPIEYSTMGDKIIGDNYSVAFLSPLERKESESSYKTLDGASNPTETEINNVSPIIYLVVEGVRFLFTGDAGKIQENLVINNYKVGLYKKLFKDVDVNLSCIDYLKVSHHGSNDASGEDFLNLLKPKNAIISVGGGNSYGHPYSDLLVRLESSSPDYRLFRTDVSGTVVVYKDNNGSYLVSTDLDS